MLREGKAPKSGQIAITSEDIANEIANANGEPNQQFIISATWNKDKAACYTSFVSQEDAEILALELGTELNQPEPLEA